MTNDEISKWLMNLKDDIGKTQYQPLWHYAEALDMAIKALETQDRQAIIAGSYLLEGKDNVPINDCISRKAAIDLIMGQPPEPHYPSWYAEQIRTLPLVLPEIIRCKECTWYHIVIEPQYVEYCELTECTVFRNDFCSRAERRTDGV